MAILSLLQKNENNFYSFGATVCRAFSRFLLVFIASLLLSKYEFGIFNIFLSIYFFARLFSENSLNLPFIKFASDGEYKVAAVNFQMVLLKIVYVLVVSLVIILASDFIVKYSGVERKSLLFILPFMLFSLTAYMFVGQILISQLRMRLLFFYELLSCLVFVVFLAVSFFISVSFTTEKLAVIFTWATGGAALAGVIIYRRLIELIPRLNKELLWKIVHYSKFTVLSGISSVLILKVDVLMLGYFCSPIEVGVYGMAIFVNEAVNMVFDSVLRVCLPQASALTGINDRSRIRILFQKSVKDMYMGIIPIVLIIAMAAPTVIHMIYKGAYDDSILLIYIFLASSLVKPVGYVAGVILGATGNIKLDNRNCWISALLNLGFNFLLIPRYGVMGAAVASAFSFASLTILHYLALQKNIFSQSAGKEELK